MGKINENALKKYRSNVRVDPACLSHYMCYYCGMIHSDRLEYQQHMLKVHEVLSQSYQLWSDHTMDSLGLRWSESKQSDEHENSGSYSASPKSVSKAKDSEDDDEDYVYEEDEKSSRKRRRDDEGGKSKGKKTAERMKKDESRRKIDAENKRRKRADERRREEKFKREEEMRMAEEAAMKSLEVKDKVETVREVKRIEVVEEERRPESISSEKKKRRRTDGSRRKDEQQDKNMPEVDFLVKKILEEGKKKEVSREETEDVDMEADPECKNRRILEANATTTKYCKVCKKGTHYNFATLFQHYIQHHHAVIQSFNYYGYNGMKLVAKRTLTASEVCLRCVVKFPSSDEYYYHMIANHIFESVRCQPEFETATHADIEAKLAFRDRILTCGYRLALVLPEKPSTPPAVPGSSVSQAPTTQETKPETEASEVAKEESKEALEHDEPSTSIVIPMNSDLQ